MLDPSSHADILSGRGFTLADWFVLSIPGQWPIRASTVPNLASLQSEEDPRGSISVSMAKKTLDSLINRGLLEVVDLARWSQLTARHSKAGWPYPVHGFPMEGDVDFTDQGAGTFKSLADLLYGPDFFSSAEVDSDDGQELIYYSVSADQARHIAEEAEKQTPGRVVIVEPIGPWCIFWWKTFASGYRVSVLKKGRSARTRLPGRDLDVAAMRLPEEPGPQQPPVTAATPTAKTTVDVSEKSFESHDRTGPDAALLGTSDAWLIERKSTGRGRIPQEVSRRLHPEALS